MPDTVGFVTELIANYCDKGLSHRVSRPSGLNLFMPCSLLDINDVNFYCSLW